MNICSFKGSRVINKKCTVKYKFRNLNDLASYSIPSSRPIYFLAPDKRAPITRGLYLFHVGIFFFCMGKVRLERFGKIHIFIFLQNFSVNTA